MCFLKLKLVVCGLNLPTGGLLVDDESPKHIIVKVRYEGDVYLFIYLFIHFNITVINYQVIVFLHWNSHWHKYSKL